MPRTKGSDGKKKTNSRLKDTSRMSERQVATTRTSIGTTTRRGGKSRPASAGKESSWATKSTKRSNRTAHSPHPKRCRLHEQDDDSSSSKDAEGFDDVPLMKADIPKIVEAVMNQFSKKGDDSQDEDQDNPNPHLNKYLTDVSISV